MVSCLRSWSRAAEGRLSCSLGSTARRDVSVMRRLTGERRQAERPESKGDACE